VTSHFRYTSLVRATANTRAKLMTINRGTHPASHPITQTGPESESAPAGAHSLVRHCVTIDRPDRRGRSRIDRSPDAERTRRRTSPTASIVLRSRARSRAPHPNESRSGTPPQAASPKGCTLQRRPPPRPRPRPRSRRRCRRRTRTRCEARTVRR